MEKLTRRKFMELTGAAAVVAGASSLTGCCMPEEIVCEPGEPIEIENGVFASSDEAKVNFYDDRIIIFVGMMFAPEEGETISVRAKDFQLSMNGEKVQDSSLYIPKNDCFLRGDQEYAITAETEFYVLGELPQDKWKDEDDFVIVKFFYGSKCYVIRLDRFKNEAP